MTLETERCIDSVQTHGQWLSTPIKVVKIHRNYVFFGQDNFLKCIQLDSNEEILNLNLFRSYSTSITNISIYETTNDWDGSLILLVLVTAGSLLKLLKIKLVNDSSDYCFKNYEIVFLYDELCCFDEFILTTYWINSKEFIVVRGNCVVQWYNYKYEGHLELETGAGPGDQSIQCINYMDPNSTSILYSASVYANHGKLIIFTGTVYSVVGIYTTDQNNGLINLNQLRGHNGVIFGIDYCPQKRIILSASDDRTVIVWTIYPGSKVNGFVDPLLDTNTHVQKTHCLSYHVARVFKAVLVQNTIFSVGEDSNLGMWSIEENSIRLKKTYASHGGSGIWSTTESNETNQIISCANDGSIYKWSTVSPEPRCRTLESPWLTKTNFHDSRQRPDFPRSVKLLNDSGVIITTDTGMICVERRDQCFENLELSWSQYACLAVSKDSPVIAVGGLKGQVLGIALQLPDLKFLDKTMVIQEDNENIPTSKALKILSIHFLSNDFLIASSIQHLSKIQIHIDEEERVRSSSVWKCKNPLNTPQISSIYELEGVLLCGLGNGDLSVLNLQNGKVLRTFEKCHSKYGVGGITEFHKQIVTGGRDGKLNFFTMREVGHDLDLAIIKSQFLPFNWIGGISKFKDDLLIYGFEYESFVIYSWIRQQIIGRIECAGAHHSWDFHLSLNMMGRFVTIVDQKVLLTEVDLQQYFNCSIQEGLHKKQINCACQILNVTSPTFKNLLIATGGEDCKVEINSFRILECKEKLEFTRERTETVMTHSSAVKDLCYKEINANSGILLSGGGKMELVVIRLTFGEMGNITFYQRLQQLLPWDLPDLRILKLEVSFLIQRWSTKPKYPLIVLPNYAGTEICDIPTLHVYMATSDGDVWLVRENKVMTKFKSLQRNALHSARVVSQTPKVDNIFAISSSGILYHWINHSEADIRSFVYPVRYITISLTGSTSLEVILSQGSPYFYIITGDQGGHVILWKLPQKIIEKPKIMPILRTKFNTTVSGLEVQLMENHSIRCYISTTGQELGILRWPNGNHTSISGGVADCQGVLACKLFHKDHVRKFMFSYGNGCKLFSDDKFIL